VGRAVLPQHRGTVAGWVRNTPKDFAFSVKLPKVITHDKTLNLEKGAEVDLNRFLELMEPVRRSRKLGVLLIQLPPSFRKSLRRLEEFLKALPEGYRWAVEFRHPSWLTEETWELLRTHRVANTIVDEPLLPPDIVVTTEHALIRWHGHGSAPWYNYRYRDDELAPWAKTVMELEARQPEIYGYLNNHFRGYAVESCLKLLKLLGRATEEQQRASQHIEQYFAGEIGQKSLSEFL